MQVHALLLTACLMLAVTTTQAARVLRQDSSNNDPLSGSTPVTYFWGQNLNADTLIQDAQSLKFKGNHPYFYGMSGPDTDTPEKCYERCARTTGCNGFVSCNKPEGCGAGCKGYVAEHPAEPSSFDDYNYEKHSTPVLGFGAWTYPLYDLDGCANVSANSKDTSDKWGWGLCSLKILSDEASPQFWESSEGSSQDEWVSGVLTKPADCPDGLPYAICAKCNSVGPDQKWPCLECAQALKVGSPVKEATAAGELPYDWCPKCFRSTKMWPADCLQCVKDKAWNGDLYECA